MNLLLKVCEQEGIQQSPHREGQMTVIFTLEYESKKFLKIETQLQHQY